MGGGGGGAPTMGAALFFIPLVWTCSVDNVWRSSYRAIWGHIALFMFYMCYIRMYINSY